MQVDQRMFEIAPSILSADFTKLADEIETVRSGGATILHVDVMDGHFVPNITIGIPVVKSIRKVTDMTIDTHLMISDPGTYAVQFAEAGADMVSIHVEADPHIQRTLTAIRHAGAKAGVAINPGTPIETLTEVLAYSDFILLMSVNPGFGGQRFIPTMVDKLRRLKQMIASSGYSVRIEIDGGIDSENISEIVNAGADMIVAGSAIFGKDDPAAAVREMISSATAWV